MSDLISRKAMLEWLESERTKVRFGLLAEPDDSELLKVEYSTLSKCKEKIESIQVSS